MIRLKSSHVSLLALMLVVVPVPGCGTATAPAIAPTSPKLVAWAPASGGILYAEYTAPSRLTSLGTVQMHPDAAYDNLRPSGVSPSYVAWVVGLPSLNDGESVTLDYKWFPDGEYLRGEHMGTQEFMYTSGQNDYIATP